MSRPRRGAPSASIAVDPATQAMDVDALRDAMAADVDGGPAGR